MVGHTNDAGYPHSRKGISAQRNSVRTETADYCSAVQCPTRGDLALSCHALLLCTGAGVRPHAAPSLPPIAIAHCEKTYRAPQRTNLLALSR